MVLIQMRDYSPCFQMAIRGVGRGGTGGMSLQTEKNVVDKWSCFLGLYIFEKIRRKQLYHKR